MGKKQVESESELFRNRRGLQKEGIYHITQRAPGSDVLFLEDNDRLHFLKLMKNVKKEFNLDIFCFCLMTNHLHILLKINQLNLSQAMMVLFKEYALYFNSKYKRKGHVFKGRYGAFLCTDECYLITASVYIHLNPYKAGVVKDPLEYRWSSLRAYYFCPKNTFLNYWYVLKFLGKDLEEAKYQYRQMIEGCADLKFSNIVKTPKELRRNAKYLFNRVKTFISKNKDINSIAGKERVEFDIRTDKKRLRGPKEKEARKYLIKQLLSQGYKLVEIAEILNISRQTVYNTLKH